jgi:hypothetical protein
VETKPQENCSRSRAFEVGFLTSKPQLTYYISFQGFPIWLFAVEANVVASIHMVQFENKGEFTRQIDTSFGVIGVSLVGFLIHRIGEHKFVYGKCHAANDGLHLISGDIHFLNAILPTVNRAIGCAILDSPFHGQLHQGRPSGDLGWLKMVWHRLRHISVGGATSYCGLLTIFGADFSPKLSALRRCIRSFFDFGTRPSATNPPSHPKALVRVYTLEDRLVVGRYQQLIRFPTSFCLSGWGVRALSMSELAKAHGFPQVLATRSDFPAFCLTLPPIQLLDAVIDGHRDWVREGASAQHALSADLSTTTTLDIHTGTTVTRDAPTARVRGVRSLCTETHSWIPALQKYLSHEWIDNELITTKAIKHDNACAPLQLWDRRLTLFFPTIAPILSSLRRLLLQKYRRKLCREALAYL